MNHSNCKYSKTHLVRWFKLTRWMWRNRLRHSIRIQSQELGHIHFPKWSNRKSWTKIKIWKIPMTKSLKTNFKDYERKQTKLLVKISTICMKLRATRKCRVCSTALIIICLVFQGDTLVFLGVALWIRGLAKAIVTLDRQMKNFKSFWKNSMRTAPRSTSKTCAFLQSKSHPPHCAAPCKIREILAVGSC
jgi:hypothetical protein